MSEKKEQKFTIEGTADNFNREVKEYKGVVLVEFLATWCGHCRMFAPTIEKFAEEKKGEIKVITVDIDKEQELAKKANIQVTPTLILFKEGQRMKISTGSRSQTELESWVESSLNSISP